MKAPPIVIVGAGIAGLSLAHALRRHGEQALVLAPDSGDSAIGAGIASAQFDDPELSAIARRGQQRLRSLVPVRSVAMAQIALSTASAAITGRIVGGREGLPRELSAVLAPGFRRRIVHASFTRAAFWLDNRALLAALGRGSWRRRERVLTMAPDGLGVSTAAGRVPARAVVIACGPATARLLPRAPLELRRAALARIQGPLPAMLHVLDSGLYARPDGERAMLVGDGDAPFRAAPGPRTRVVPAGFVRLAGERMSELLGMKLAARPHTAGLVARTRSGHPLAGRLGRYWVFAGFHGDGLVLAPGLADSLARRILAEA